MTDPGTEFLHPPAVPAGGRVVLQAYDLRWPALFAAQADRIHHALGSVLVDVQHVGSTSVPGLDAKPILDINVLVVDSADEQAYVPALESLDYVLHVREPGWYEHRLLRLEGPAVNLHVFATGSAEHDRMVRFRDLLRGDDALRDRYLAEKRALSRREWSLVQDYADAKTAVIEDILSAHLPER